MCPLFLRTAPCNLFRLGNSTKSKIDVVRTSPPRAADEKVDIESFFHANGEQWVDSQTGGVSLFNQPMLRMGKYWYMIPINTEIPTGLVITQDGQLSSSGDAVHYSVRPSHDMSLRHYVGLLQLLLPHAKPAHVVSNTQAQPKE